MTAAACHPEGERLRAFAVGQLPETDSREIEHHQADCPACRQEVEAAPDDALVAALQEVKATATADDAALPPPPPPLYRKLQALLRPGERPQENPEATALPAALNNHPRYRMLEPLGRGGMGSVYRARHLVMDRDVALKVIRPELLGDPTAVERFRREVRAAAQLSHPNIVTAHDAESWGNVHFLVMEYVPGQPLSRLGESHGRLAVATVCGFARQVALGLQHAFEHGMVHRDIKPHNLILTPAGQVKILDFGLARFVSETGAEPGAVGERPRRSLTACGTVLGSPDYMAPEQATAAQKADIRADIYSLGGTLYFLLTGVPPFPENALQDKLDAHRSRQPPALRLLRPDVPSALADLIGRMLAKDPNDRPATPAEVAAALLPFLRPDEPRPSPSRRYVRAGAAAGVLTLLLTMAVVFGPTVFRILTNQGVLVVETDDPAVEVVVKQDGAVVQILDTRTQRSVTLPAGAYEADLGNAGDGLKLVARQFTITRGGRAIVKVLAEGADPPAPRPPAAPDFSGTKPLLDDPLGDPKRTRLAREMSLESFDRYFEDGRYVLAYKWDKPNAFASFRAGDYQQAPFACQVVARARGAVPDGWGLDLLEKGPEQRGLALKLSRGGLLSFSGSFRKVSDFPGTLPPPVLVASARKGDEENTLLVLLRPKRLEVYVNGVRACEPIPLTRKLFPVLILLSARCERAGARAEFRRVTVWPLPPGDD